MSLKAICAILAGYRHAAQQESNMADPKKTLIDLLPKGKVRKAGKTISLRQRYQAIKAENIGTGKTLPPFEEWAKTQK